MNGRLVYKCVKWHEKMMVNLREIRCSVDGGVARLSNSARPFVAEVWDQLSRVGNPDWFRPWNVSSWLLALGFSSIKIS